VERPGAGGGEDGGRARARARARLRLTIRGHSERSYPVLPAIGRREIHNTFFIDAGELPRPPSLRPDFPSGGGYGSRVESILRSRDESSRAEAGLERFAGRLRAFDPKCTVGAREVEEAEEYRRAKEEKGGEVALLRGPANWVRCARIVVRGSLSGRKPNIAAAV
jgi:hypothetical protein